MILSNNTEEEKHKPEPPRAPSSPSSALANASSSEADMLFNRFLCTWPHLTWNNTETNKQMNVYSSVNNYNLW